MSGLLPVLLAAMAASMFGVSAVISKRGLGHVDVHTGSLIIIGAALAVYLLTSPLWMRAGDWFTLGFWVFVANGLIHPMLSMYMALEATSRTGPTVAATFASTAPLFAALTAIVFLGETLGLFVVLGTLAAIGGVMVLSWAPGGIPQLTRVALVFATGAAAVRGLNQTIGKFGIELLPNVYMAGFLSFLVSFVASLALYRFRRGHLPAQVPRAGLGLFGVAGVLIAVAVGCMYAALALGRVVVVSPIIATYPLFTLLTGVLLGDERLGLRILAGVALAVLGVALVSVGSAIGARPGE